MHSVFSNLPKELRLTTRMSLFGLPWIQQPSFCSVFASIRCTIRRHGHLARLFLLFSTSWPNAAALHPYGLSLSSRATRLGKYLVLHPVLLLTWYGTSKNLETIRGFVKPIIKAALERKEMNQGSSAESETLLDELVAQTTGNRFPHLSIRRSLISIKTRN